MAQARAAVRCRAAIRPPPPNARRQALARTRTYEASGDDRRALNMHDIGDADGVSVPAVALPARAAGRPAQDAEAAHGRKGHDGGPEAGQAVDSHDRRPGVTRTDCSCRAGMW